MRDGKPTLFRLPEVDFIDDKAGKPVGINAVHRPPADRRVRQFRRRPRNAAMDHGRDGPRFGLIVHHTDAEREYAYDRDAASAGSTRRWMRAGHNGWTVVDMKDDWKQIFP